MKLLVVTQYFYPENFRFNDLVRDLAKDNEVTVLTGIPNYPEGKFFKGYGVFRPFHEEYHGAEVIHCPLIPRGNSKILLALNYLSFAILSSILAALIVPFRKYDKILVCQLSPITMAFPAIVYRLFRKTPVVLWVTDLWPESLQATNSIHNTKVLKAVDNMVAWIYRHVDLILVSCRGFEQNIRSKVSNSNIVYFPYWAEDVISHEKKQLPFPSEFKFMFAGNIGVAQNLNLLVDAVSDLSREYKFKVIIVGDGREKNSLEDHIAKHKLQDHFVFLGSFASDEMPGIYAHADALYLSLRKDPIFEITVPSKLQSYMACAKPIVASIDGEAAMLIEEAGCGLISPAGDRSQLAKNLKAVLEMSRETREELGVRAEKYYKQYFTRTESMKKIRQLISKAEHAGS